MTKTRAWPVRVMHMLIATALVISLMIMVAPARQVSAEAIPNAEWERVSTPTMEGLVLAPDSHIIDFAVAAQGDVTYAIVDGWYMRDGEYVSDYWLLKSTDGAATWKDLNEALEELLDDGDFIDELIKVATDGTDPDFVAVALIWYDYSVDEYFLSVFTSNDGGVTFEDDPGEVEDGGDYLYWPFDLAISPEDDGEREIAIGGVGDGLIFRSHVSGGSASAWEDATDYDGWDDDGGISSMAVVDIQFSPSWDTDHTILVATVTGSGPNEDVHLQSGTWGITEAWNAEAGFAAAVPVIEDADIPYGELGGLVAGLTLPLDYYGRTTDTRYAWVWVNYYNDDDEPAATIFRVKDDDADPVGPMGQIEDGELWLTNVFYLGYISEGKAIGGVLGDGMGDEAECCAGVAVYRNDGIINMDVCCIPWEEACKPPTGVLAMAAFYVSADKAYAVALGGFSYDEGAWSVSFDDGDTWNQLSLVDTHIDYFSDVAVSPDCNKTMLVSINEETGCGCDSVWLHAVNLPEAPEYSGQWLRTWCGQLGSEQYGLLRLAPEETTGDTVYLVDRGTDTIYLNELETLACWTPLPSGPGEIDNIVDLAVKDRETIYALDEDGYVAMLDAEDWHEAVHSEVDDGWTIAVWGQDILVGGQHGDVSHSADGGETFTELKDGITDGYVTVAFDSYFDTNGMIYAAVNTIYGGGIYRWKIDDGTSWTDLHAKPSTFQLTGSGSETDSHQVAYTGLVLDTADGNPRTSAATGGVLYASYVTAIAGQIVTGVARYLTPAEDVVCQECGDWDYLIWTEDDRILNQEAFYFMPHALKICGCLTPDSNSKLFAIDGLGAYDMEEHEDGSVWMFEDCYAKTAPAPASPADGAVIGADPCSCFNVPFTLVWDRQCDACVYDIQFALDEFFTSIVESVSKSDHLPSAGDVPSYHVPGGFLTCEFTYYWRVRAIKADTGQVIRSWWSLPRSVTIAPAAGTGVTLITPEPGATDVATTDLAFTWAMTADADSYDWVLSANANLSGPVETRTGLTTTAWTSNATLTYDSPYYWQVTALKAGAVINVSPIGTFTTVVAAEYCSPISGLCFDTEAELSQHHEELQRQQMATPVWVWVIIALGAVLVIVVIVLIFRTRRV